MARTVQLACARCGHQEMYVVESLENGEIVAEVARASADRETAEKDNSMSEAERLRRLKSLPTSLPVGGIITPV